QEILHEARSASLPRSQKKKVLEFLKPLVEDLEDYVQDVDRLLQDAGFLEPFLDPHPKRREHLDYLKRLSQRNHQEKTLDYFDLSILLRIIQLKTGGLP
ncbi:MAG: hypothetical protein GWN24_11900, partial [Nitrospinaceae bacterium]|nr:hypothetical protein [Nitrospinaceae bacterium]